MSNRPSEPKLQFAQIRPLDGHKHAWATVELRDVEDMTRGSDYEMRHVWMTRKEFEDLPEFGGW